MTYFDDEEIQKCLPYLLDNDIIKIEEKGFRNLKRISNIKDKEIDILHSSTKTKNIIKIIEKNNITANKLISKIYTAYIKEQIKIEKFDKCLIVNNLCEDILETKLKLIQNDIELKRTNKHELLNYFTYLLDNYTNSKELHQEIGLYLGVPRFNLNKIYTTQKGDLVRSKSEVIIANMLYTSDIKYEYEKRVNIGGKSILPDFTIYHDGQVFYWEHLGLIGIESYDHDWMGKKKVYDEFFPDNLIITYESPNLTDSVIDRINTLTQNT